MAASGSYGVNPRLDIQQLLIEAQHRWLRPAEICEILCNYQKFHITSEPQSRPPSGSLFLFDRKVLRYFRKDGHNWRKKKDGKTVKEAHEKLKVGSVDVLHCYYAHGEETENFQRRSYWMLEQDLMHIVFVHYLDVKGNITNIGGVRETDEVISDLQKGSPLSFSFPTNYNKEHSGNTDSTSPTSTLTSLCEEADSEDSHQASSKFHSFLENGPVMDKMDAGILSSFLHPCSDNHEGQSSIPGLDYISHVHKDRPRDCDDATCMIESQNMLGLASWEEVFQQCMMGVQTVPSYASMSSTELATTGIVLEQGKMILSELQAGKSAVKQESGSPLPIQSNWQIPVEGKPRWPIDGTLDSAFVQNGSEPFFTQFDHQNEQPMQNNLQCLMESNSENDMPIKGNINYAFSVKQPLFDRDESLKKVDSFSRWITKELGEIDDLHVPSTSGISWSTVECGNVVDESMLSPSLSQDQLFSIINFWPKWAYTDSETEVLVTGTFLKSQQEVAKSDWSCMFGEVEVPVEVVADGVLSCYAPPHRVGRVPFYVTCSNRLACSEVREFEYRVGSCKDVDITEIYNGATSLMLLHVRLERLLSLRSVSPPNQPSEGVREKQNIISQIISLKEEEECYQMADPTSDKDCSQHEVKEQLGQKLMKERLYSWLLHKLPEDGKGPSVLDDDGQGVLHLAAALGYDWAIKPTVAAGVTINFRDVNGWTALHWAAFCGREQTVAVLVSMGAAPGALTDPSPEFPLGRTPADLASANGHKGISGFLAESSLTSHLSSLAVNDGALEVSRPKAVQTVSERTATAINDGDAADALSLKDSLTAVCNAKHAADRIHQVFRMQSFQRKQLTNYGSDEFGLSDECALSLLAVKTRKTGQSDGLAHASAIQIQKKFRGWKKRKEFLIIRQRIVKIQAHVRGHQVRKQYRPIVWSVGILEKVILRWRRKGSGLRGYRRDAVTKDPNSPGMFIKEDDYDFLKEGRKQTEERLEKALTRVKSMVQYPEARAQYCRLLNVVEGFRETKVCNTVGNSSEEMVHGEEDLIDIDLLLDDDSFML